MNNYARTGLPVRIFGLASAWGVLALSVGCRTQELGTENVAKQAVTHSTSIDSSHPYVVKVWRGINPCTGTLLPGGFVLTAAHCFYDGNETISSPEVLGSLNPNNYFVHVDLDGDLETYTDQFYYSPTHIKIGRELADGYGDKFYLDMALLYFAPGVAKPHDLFKPIALGGMHPLDLPKVVTSFQDNATPSDLADSVVHVQFDPVAFFSPPASGPPPYRFDFFGFGLNSYLTPNDYRYRLAARQTPTAYAYSTWSGGPSYGGVSARYVTTVAVDASDGSIAIGDSGGALFTTSAISGISFPTANSNEPFALSVVSIGDPVEKTGKSPLIADDVRGPMLERWMREFLEDADQDGIPDLRDNCIARANYFQDNSNLDAERKLYDPTNPTAGRVPEPGESSYALDYREHYPGNNCENNPVAHITQRDEVVRLGNPVSCPLYRDDYVSSTLVSTTAGQCKVRVRGASLAFDGYREPQGLFVLPAQGHVYPSVCLCSAPYALNRLEKKRWCDINAGCSIAVDSSFAGVSDFGFRLNGWTRIHETEVESESATDPALLSFDTSFSTVNYKIQPKTVDRRTSRWDTQQDLSTFGKNPEAALFEAAFWSFAKGPFVSPSAGTIVTAENRTSSYLYGLVSSFREPQEVEYASIDLGFVPADLVPYRRAPWYDDAYRLVSDVRTWVLPVPQTGGGVRVFALDKAQHSDVTDRYSGTLRARLGAGTSTSVLVSGFGAHYGLPAVEVAKEDGDVLSEMKWDDNEAFWKLEDVASGGAMPGALGAVALDDVHKRLWSINDMGTYKYISTRERQWYGPWQVTWYKDISTEIMPTVLFPLVAERAAVGMVIADNKLRFTRYDTDQDTTLLWEVPVAADTYRMTVEPDGVQGGILTLRRQSNGHALVFLLNHLGLPENGFVIGNQTVVSSVLVNEEGFAYVATQTPTAGKPPLKTVTRSWANLDDIPTLMQSLAGGI